MLIYKKFLKRAFILFILLILLIISMNYLIDPYGYNSKDSKFIKNLTMFNKPHVTNARINSEGYFYLIGSSRMSRVNPKEIELISGKKTHNIKIDGATLAENSMLASEVKKKGSFFIYSFDVFSTNKSRQNYKEINKRFDVYKSELQNNLFFNKYYNSDITIRSLQHLIKLLKGEKLNKHYLEENSRPSNYSMEIAINQSGISNNIVKSNFSNFEIYSDKEIINLAKLGEKDDIFIIFPKYQSYYSLFAKYQDIEKKYFSAIKTLVNNTEAQVWAFYGNNSITKNENNFIDNGWHFKPFVSTIIFKQVFAFEPKKNNHQSGTKITKENLDNYLFNVSKEIKDNLINDY